MFIVMYVYAFTFAKLVGLILQNQLSMMMHVGVENVNVKVICINST